MADTIKKKEGFKGQKAIVIPRQVLNSKCAKNDLMGTLYVTDIGYYPKAMFHFRERAQGADQHIFIYCHEGSGRATIGKIEYKIEAGDFICIPQKTPHRYAADENDAWTIYWIHFKGSLAGHIISLIEKQTGLKGFVKYNEKGIELFNQMYNQLERGYGIDSLTFTNMCLWHFLNSFLYNDKFNPGGKFKSKDAPDIAIDFLNSHISEMLTLVDIASEVNLSPSHFSYLFKTKTGFSPIEYFNHLKVQKACQYLLFTNLRIKEIS